MIVRASRREDREETCVRACVSDDRLNEPVLSCPVHSTRLVTASSLLSGMASNGAGHHLRALVRRDAHRCHTFSARGRTSLLAHRRPQRFLAELEHATAGLHARFLSQ
ncbi:hypothetical protein ZWY2020_035075 [Hordeum vulgare]|nr:hypothetical protein ZWY2020_035075 [Hordeum vulgare]